MDKAKQKVTTLLTAGDHCIVVRQVSATHRAVLTANEICFCCASRQKYLTTVSVAAQLPLYYNRESSLPFLSLLSLLL